MNRTFICIGHRGTRILDENTIYAFTKALKYGAEYIEFDIRKTKDNKLIVIHDATLERTTIGSGLIKNLTYDQISKYKTKMNDEKIPLLSDVLEIFKGKIKFMIELKEEFIVLLGPMGITEFNDLKDKSATGKDEIFEYIDSLEKLNILRNTDAEKFKINVGKIFGDEPIKEENYKLDNETLKKEI